MQYLMGSTADGLGLDISEYSANELRDIVTSVVPQATSNIQDLTDNIVKEGGLLPSVQSAFEKLNEEV